MRQFCFNYIKPVFYAPYVLTDCDHSMFLCLYFKKGIADVKKGLRKWIRVDYVIIIKIDDL